MRHGIWICGRSEAQERHASAQAVPADHQFAGRRPHCMGEPLGEADTYKERNTPGSPACKAHSVPAAEV